MESTLLSRCKSNRLLISQSTCYVMLYVTVLMLTFTNNNCLNNFYINSFITINYYVLKILQEKVDINKNL